MIIAPAKLLMPILVAILVGVTRNTGSVSISAKQALTPVRTTLAIRVEQHGFYYGCSQIMVFSMRSDGKVEYDVCREVVSDEGRLTFTADRRQTAVSAQAASDLARLVESSGFLNASDRYYSGMSGTDVSSTTTITYNGAGGGKTVVVKNYHPRGPLIPESIHKVIDGATNLVPDDSRK